MLDVRNTISGPEQELSPPDGSYTTRLQRSRIMSAHDTPARPAPQAEVEYRLVSGFPDYRVGSDGSVWSRRPRAGMVEHPGGWHRLRPLPVGRHYFVRFSVNRKKTSKLIHRLVLEAFVGPCPPGQECCHWDGNPANNRLDNLRWDTRQANVDDMLRHGTRLYGSRGNCVKLKDEDVREVRRLRSQGYTLRRIAARLGVAEATIWDICSGRTWGWLHGGT
jgi:hypothetical protein